MSFLAFFMAMIVQSVVAFDISGDNEAVGTVVAGQGIAMAAFGPLGGAFADRWPKRRVIAISQGVTVFTFVALAGLVARGQINIELLAAGSVVIGATLAFLGPARQGLVVATRIEENDCLVLGMDVRFHRPTPAKVTI